MLRKFDCVQEFFRHHTDDFALAKGAFIGAFVGELRDAAPPECGHLLEELDTLICEHNGMAVVGVFPTGGRLDETLDGLLRLQEGFRGHRIGYLLSSIGRLLPQPRILHQDRVRKLKGKGKGDAPGGEGRKGGKGKPKGTWQGQRQGCSP